MPLTEEFHPSVSSSVRRYLHHHRGKSQWFAIGQGGLSFGFPRDLTIHPYIPIIPSHPYIHPIPPIHTIHRSRINPYQPPISFQPVSPTDPYHPPIPYQPVSTRTEPVSTPPPTVLHLVSDHGVATAAVAVPLVRPAVGPLPQGVAVGGGQVRRARVGRVSAVAPPIVHA